MAKKVTGFIKLQIQAGQANPAPPVGPALGQHGVNIMDFCKAFNAQTQDMMGDLIPVEITVYADRSYTFVTKTPPAARLILKAAKVKKGSGEPNRQKVGKVTLEDLQAIAKIKMDDLNANTLDQAVRMIRGTCVSMGIEVKG
tara:strand:- start:1270 stop:1695 length:426 start_codon:yes stop_codon:yes gene_type:complete